MGSEAADTGLVRYAAIETMAEALTGLAPAGVYLGQGDLDRSQEVR